MKSFLSFHTELVPVFISNFHLQNEFFPYLFNSVTIGKRATPTYLIRPLTALVESFELLSSSNEGRHLLVSRMSPLKAKKQSQSFWLFAFSRLLLVKYRHRPLLFKLMPISSSREKCLLNNRLFRYFLLRRRDFLYFSLVY